LLGSDQALLTALSLFGIGLLLAFSPCVFPMIPILSSIIIGQGQAVTTRRAFTLSLVYVLAMALTYTAAGVIAGLFGENLQIAFQSPWIIISFSLIFVALALSMFGFYELQLPERLQSRLNEISNRQQNGKYLGVAVMGCLSALIVGPCVAAPLAGVLIYIGLSGDAWMGGFSLFMMSLGMGLPLLIIGTSAGKLLPRVGPWMTTVKAIFGVLLLGMTIWMLERILPGPVALLLWAALLVGSAVNMGALSRLEPEADGWQKLWKAAGLVMLIYGGTLIIGATSGNDDVFQPLKSLRSTSLANNANHASFEPVKGLTGLTSALNAATLRNQPVMLDFYADWCVECKKLEKATFADPAVVQALAGFRLLQTDVTANDAEDQALLKKYGLFGPPAILFFDNLGREISSRRLIGFLDADDFQNHIKSIHPDRK
jgi:thiol:disulfide interchange protein DsbD